MFRIPARFGLLAWTALVGMGLSSLLRLGLAIHDGSARAGLSVGQALQVMGTGVVYDLAAVTYLLVPFALWAWAWPNTTWGRRWHGVTALALAMMTLVLALFVTLSEVTFWLEFSSRFNFIAVDYLVYTREVIGNIRQSYPVGWILSGLVVVALGLATWLWRPFARCAFADAGSFLQRTWVMAMVLALPVASFVWLGDEVRDALPTAGARALASNGPYEFMRAARSNDLNFKQFHRTLPTDVVNQEMRAEWVEAGGKSRFTGGRHPLEREVLATHPNKPMHVVLVSIESLGSDYVESFGGRPGLTPHLDRLAQEGLMFTRLYATGLRTVRGLEALTLSIPPTPGHAVPMRHLNKGFQTLGGVLKEQGYEALYVYGGYSRFDNMRDFFGGNGYTVIDRSAIDAKEISHETIWGVADEDLFRLAIKSIDEQVAGGKKVFAHVMTTSNHRPYTFPAGRIDLTSGSGRDAAVKYTDWAIGDFVRAAKTKPWFKDTMFVFVADHTSNGRGKTNLPPENFRIPMIMYAPGVVAAGKVDTLASQIDVAPTLLAMLGVSYTSQFFGQDILTEGVLHPRAFMANYLTVGYMQEGAVVELSPKQGVHVLDALTGEASKLSVNQQEHLTNEAVSYYQMATDVLSLMGRSEPPVH